MTAASLLLALGIIFGDIGTSPLYVMKAIVGNLSIEKDIIMGALSCVFWTLTLQTSIKYVILTLRADNNGEGGIFSLYTLVKRLKKPWLLVPAIIGGSALLADGIITPPISVSSAIEGLRIYNPEINTIGIVISILFVLFFVQRFGTQFIGKFFGPIMLLWFLMLGFLGALQLFSNFEVLQALNPYYAFHLVYVHPEGFFVLGFVFLCTTGAEALYSDLGHCGIKNIRISWIFVKLMLLINYFGQGAFLIAHEGQKLASFSGNTSNVANPFYLIMPNWFLPIGIGIATMAAIIASQALLSGSFSLISEAIRLNLWPRVKIKYPSELKGQIYIPFVNWLLFVGCVFIVLLFGESSNMEAAYGFAIVTCMLMTTTLLTYYMIMKKYNKFFILLFVVLFTTLEMSFFIANASKFSHGGYVSVFIAGLLALTMFIWHKAKKITKSYTEFVDVALYKDILSDLTMDQSITKYASHLVYLTNASKTNEVESKIIYSILHKRPKKADVYWFVHVNVTDKPYEQKYKVTKLMGNEVIRIDFYLGFKVSQKINLLFKMVLKDMVKNNEIDITSRYDSLQKNNVVGDFKFVLIEKFLSYESRIPWYEQIILDSYFFIKKISMSEEKAFGLDSSSVKVEKFPIVIMPNNSLNLERITNTKK
ncbi:MAG: KUP/HAK/KT family potassium transporter [Flavobacterium sp.]|nr:KUP/HAK/KT family potassium transporter [Candidatus Neoflavobacterium equi]